MTQRAEPVRQDARYEAISTMLQLMRDSYVRSLYKWEEYRYWQKVNALKEKPALWERIDQTWFMG